jgi:hypothetical protein
VKKKVILALHDQCKRTHSLYLAPILTPPSLAPQTMGVHRDCFECGRTCSECRARYMRTCRFCRAEYCVIDNEGSSDTEVCSVFFCVLDSQVVDQRTLTFFCSLLRSAIGAIRAAGGRGRCFEVDVSVCRVLVT